MANLLVTTITVKRIKFDNSIVSMPEEDLMKQALATHARDDGHIDVKSIFSVTNNILTRATQISDHITTGSGALTEHLGDKSMKATGFSAPSHVFEDITREIGCKALHGENAHKAALSVLSLLSGFSWDAKAVLGLAAFAINYGEFWLLTQHQSDLLARSVGILKRIPDILKPSDSQRAGIDLLKNTVKTLLGVTEYIVQIEKFSKRYVKEVPALRPALARIPVSVYWTIATAVYCVSHINNLTTMAEEYPLHELSSFFQMLTNIHANLRKHLDEFNLQREEYEAYQLLLKLHANPTDNVEFLKALIYIKDHIQPLVHGSTKQMAKIEELRRKHVLLHISSVSISLDELMALKQTYIELKKAKKDSDFEIVWVPIVEQWTEEVRQKFQSLQSEMPWFTVQNPSLLLMTPKGRAAIRFVKQELHFSNNTIVVSMDSHGRVQHPNAFCMIRIWGCEAYPFTEVKEGYLWGKESWRLELLLHGAHPKIPIWIKEGKYIFVYGGNDPKWIRDFEEKAKFVATEARLSLEMFNVSRINNQGKRETNVIDSFWSRLESLWFSKIHRHSQDKHDSIMHEIQKIVNYNKAGCWALLCKGSKVLANLHGSVVLAALLQFDEWKKNVSAQGFDAAFLDYVNMILKGGPRDCLHIYVPIKAGKNFDYMKCPDCNRTMEKSIAFQCCHKDDMKTIC